MVNTLREVRTVHKDPGLTSSQENQNQRVLGKGNVPRAGSSRSMKTTGGFFRATLLGDCRRGVMVAELHPIIIAPAGWRPVEPAEAVRAERDGR